MRAELALIRPLDAYAVEQVRVDKPWGYELIWSLTESYCGKMLIVHAGEALSLQLHRRKDETIYVHAGLVEVEMGEDAEDLTKEVVTAGRGFRVRPGVVHRIRALEDSLILEVSTPYLDDVVRLEDRYGRKE
jgi:mannose-6-phosphate isomerase